MKPSPRPSPASSSWRIKLFLAVGFVPATIYTVLVILRLLGLFRPFYIPVEGMAPALSKGDHVAMEGITFLVRSPRRGDIVVFESDDIELLTPGTFYVKRIAGILGDHVSISNGELFIDDHSVTLSNNDGKIVYGAPQYRHPYSFPLQTNVVVPAGCYFLLGDNSASSLDSRFFGPVPRKDIVGRIVFCYGPPSRIGFVK